MTDPNTARERAIQHLAAYVERPNEHSTLGFRCHAPNIFSDACNRRLLFGNRIRPAIDRPESYDDGRSVSCHTSRHFFHIALMG